MPVLSFSLLGLWSPPWASWHTQSSVWTLTPQSHCAHTQEVRAQNAGMCQTHHKNPLPSRQGSSDVTQIPPARELSEMHVKVQILGPWPQDLLSQPLGQQCLGSCINELHRWLVPPQLRTSQLWFHRDSLLSHHVQILKNILLNTMQLHPSRVHFCCWDIFSEDLTTTSHLTMKILENSTRLKKYSSLNSSFSAFDRFSISAPASSLQCKAIQQFSLPRQQVCRKFWADHLRDGPQQTQIPHLSWMESPLRVGPPTATTPCPLSPCRVCPVAYVPVTALIPDEITPHA